MIRIRRAALRDAAFIADTYRPFVEDGFASFETVAPDAEEMVRRMNAAEEQYPWLIVEDGAPLAYAYASQHRTRAAYVTSVDTAIYCAPDARGKGIGKALYHSLLQVLTRQNYVMAFAGIVVPNEASLALHRGVGFALIGTYPDVGYKQGAWRSTQWWARPLAAPQDPPADIRTVSDVFSEP